MKNYIMQSSNGADRIVTLECLAILALGNVPETNVIHHLRDEEFKYLQELKQLDEKTIRLLTPYHSGDFRLSEAYIAINEVSSIMGTYFENGLLIYYKWSEEELYSFIKQAFRNSKPSLA